MSTLNDTFTKVEVDHYWAQRVRRWEAEQLDTEELRAVRYDTMLTAPSTLHARSAARVETFDIEADLYDQDADNWDDYGYEEEG